MRTVSVGFGDQATWPSCTGHPLDPRTDDDGYDAFVEAVMPEIDGKELLLEHLADHPATTGELMFRALDEDGKEARAELRQLVERLIETEACLRYRAMQRKAA